MTSLKKYTRSGLAAAIVVFLAVQSAGGAVIKRADSSKVIQDMFLLGFGEVTMEALDVSGNRDVFESANPNLKEDFFTNYRLSLFANGNATRSFLLNGAAVVDSRIGEEYQTVDPSVFRLKLSATSTEPIWDNWRFTGHGVYDPERQWELANLDTRLLTQPQEPARLELLMRLESDEHGVIEGGSLRSSFKDAVFTLHQRSIFGAYTDLHADAVGVEAVAGKLEGKSYREGSSVGIRADGTSGPFDLAHAPITRGSEEVKIEVRDRFDESTVLSSRTLVRDMDYTVDYLQGEVLLNQPVASESASSDPVYIVITFDYIRDENDEIMGGRAKVMPVKDVLASGTYLHRNIDDDATGTGVEEPEDLMAADFSFKMAEHTSGYFEIAGAENADVDSDFVALRAGAKTEIGKKLTLNAGFQRIDDQFRSFTNSDLDPNKNQQRLQAGGEFRLTSRQKATASFADIRTLEANGEYNPYDGLRGEKVYALGYRNDLMDEFGFGLKYERRDVEDRSDLTHEDNYQNRAIIDLGGRFDGVALLHEFGYKVNYELIMFRNVLSNDDHDANTNQLALTLTGKPGERSSIELTQRVSVRDDRELNLYDKRQDATFITMQVRLHNNLNTLTTGEYRRHTVPGESVKLWQDDPTQIERAATFAVEYLPLDKIKAIGKAGRHDLQQWLPDSTTRATTDFVLGQLTYFHTHHLSFNGESEFRRGIREYEGRTDTKTWDLGLRVNWNKDPLNEFTVGMIRRWQKYDYPASEDVTSSSYIMLASGSVSIGRGFFARGSVKDFLLNDPLDDEKTYTTIEIGFDSRRWYRLAVGYERIEGDTDLYPDRDYTAQGAFIRFTGKM